MELLKIEYSSLFYRGSSETSYKWIHMRILSFFASDWNKQQKVFSLRSVPLQPFVTMNRKLDGGTVLAFLLISNYWTGDLRITWNLFPHVFKWMFVAVAGRLLTGAQPCHAEQAGSLRLLVQPWAAMAAVTAKPSSFMYTAQVGTGLTITQSSEPAELDPQLRKRLKDCTKLT